MTHSFPTRRSSDLWEGVKRDVGSYVWSALYQQRPAPAKGAIFDMSWWRYWTSDPARANGLDVVYLPNVATPQAGDTWVESWDMAFKDTKDRKSTRLNSSH